MPLRMQIYQLLVFLPLNFIVIESCCPYFNTETFRAKLSYLNSSFGCNAPFDELGVSFSSGGERSCNQIFAGRAFCKWRCFYECNFETLMGVQCSDVTCGGDGRDPSQLYFTCSCTGQLKNAMGSCYLGMHWDGYGYWNPYQRSSYPIPSIWELPPQLPILSNMSCSTTQHNWATVEAFFQQFCRMGMIPPVFGQKLGQRTNIQTDSDSTAIVINANGGNSGQGNNVQLSKAQKTTDQKDTVVNTRIQDTKFIFVGANGEDGGQISPELMAMAKQVFDG